MSGNGTLRERVPFTDIYVDDEIVERATDVLKSTRYVKGPELEAFEENFAEACGVEHAVGVSSGTAAILLSLRAVGVEAGDEVFVPGNTFFATVSPVLSIGATPVFVDVGPETYTMDPDDFESKVENAESPAAVLPVHIYGQMADMGRITAIADDHDVAVVADSCQAHFAERDGEIAGTAGDAGAFSFYPSKNMTVGGDGGMLVTDRDDVAETARKLRNHGRDESGTHEMLGLNYRMDELNAVVGDEQLKHIRDWNDARAEVAEQYTERLSNLDAVTTPAEAPESLHVYHLYVVQVPPEEREEFRAFLDDRGIDTGVHYETPAHQHPAVRDHPLVADTISALPQTEHLYERIVSLPMHPRLSQAEIDRTCEAIEAYFE